MENIVYSIPTVLNQVAKVLSYLSNQTLIMNFTGNYCPDSNGKLSIEFCEIEIPSSIISKPNPQFSQDKKGFYKVNRIRLGKNILDDTAKGFPYSDDEIITVIKKLNVWAYYEKIDVSEEMFVSNIDNVSTIYKHITKDEEAVDDSGEYHPNVFISYSYDSEEHKEWVKRLADDLTKKNIDVKLDQYEPAGISLTDFMRRGIKKADKVLIIGTPNYKIKAEAHKGGAKVEDQIINIHISRDFESTKFIPILRKGTYEDSFTDLVGDRKGFNFIDDSHYEKKLNELYHELFRGNNTKKIEDISLQEEETLDSIDRNQKTTLKELFVSIYIPYFTALFEKLDIEEYKYWSHNLAVSGETDISYNRYYKLRDLIAFCDSCQNQINFEEYYNLTKCLQTVLTDLLNVFDLHSKLIGEDKYRFDKFYKNHQYDPQRTPIEEKEYENEIRLIGDLTFELTRIANLLLEKIRIYDQSFMAQYGNLTIIDTPDPRGQVVYKDEEKSDCPYLGLKDFLSRKMSRIHHYEYEGIDLISTLKQERLI